MSQYLTTSSSLCTDGQVRNGITLLSPLLYFPACADRGVVTMFGQSLGE